MNEIIEKLTNYGLVPVVKIEDEKMSAPLGNALIKAGLPVAEITFRTDAAENAIKELRSKCPDIMTGAGTVINAEQAEKACQAGAQFIVTPGLDEETVSLCQEKDTPIIPGVATPTEVQKALAMGINNMKFFPAEALGGAKSLKAISAPLASARFMPLGGITPDNINQYMSLPSVFACGGTWMVKSHLIEGGNFAEITARAREAIRIVLGLELAGLDIHSPAANLLKEISAFFKGSSELEKKDIGSSCRHDASADEKMDVPECAGRITLLTNDLDRAAFYLLESGIPLEKHFDDQSKENIPGSGATYTISVNNSTLILQLLSRTTN